MNGGIQPLLVNEIPGNLRCGRYNIEDVLNVTGGQVGESSGVIPVIDIFAGPGGLGEGFSACTDSNGNPRFRVILSIEKNENAKMTLELRAFFRQFAPGQVPEEYYRYLRGAIPRSQLFASYPEQSKRASEIAWKAELGKVDAGEVDRRIRRALGGNIGGDSTWMLIGGPPCQAYSTVGRSRMRGEDPERYETDPRHFLYKEYLRILAEHRPPFFIFENVTGILSSRIKGRNAFSRILEDLTFPNALNGRKSTIVRKTPGLRYLIFPISNEASTSFSSKEVSQYIVECERYGIPQMRHRVILLGIRDDINSRPEPLKRFESAIPSRDVLDDLPQLRSCLSREQDSGPLWVEAVKSTINSSWLHDAALNPALRAEIVSMCEQLKPSRSMGGRFLPSSGEPSCYPGWYRDECLGGVCNHAARSHMRADLHRYLFAACFAKIYGCSPLLKDFPAELLPNHRNVQDAVKTGTGMFSDRFRVQIADSPATTITSHMAKDGHYFIHPDPRQCRSLTVREAARLQTFPDNYFFEGSQTSQYEQVGNAVPPLLAKSIADLVSDLIQGRKRDDSRKKFPGEIKNQKARPFQSTLW